MLIRLNTTHLGLHLVLVSNCWEEQRVEINDIITNLEIKNSTGYDYISQKIAIKCATYISENISKIIHASFRTGIVPN